METNERIKYLERYLETRWGTFAVNQEEADDYFEKTQELYKLLK